MAGEQTAEKFIDILMKIMENAMTVLTEILERENHSLESQMALMAAEQTRNDLKNGILPAFYRVHDSQVSEIKTRLQAEGIPFYVYSPSEIGQSAGNYTYISVTLANAQKMDAVVEDFNNDIAANRRMSYKEFNNYFNNAIDIKLTPAERIEMEYLLQNHARNVPYAFYSRVDSKDGITDCLRFRREDRFVINGLLNDVQWRFKVDPSYMNLREFEHNEINKIGDIIKNNENAVIVSAQNPKIRLEIKNGEWQYEKEGVVGDYGKLNDPEASVTILQYVKAIQTPVVFNESTWKQMKAPGELEKEVQRRVPEQDYSLDMEIKRFAAHGFDDIKIEEFDMSGDHQELCVKGLTGAQYAKVQCFMDEHGILKDEVAPEMQRPQDRWLVFDATHYEAVRNVVFQAQVIPYLTQDKNFYSPEWNRWLSKDLGYASLQKNATITFYDENGQYYVAKKDDDIIAVTTKDSKYELHGIEDWKAFVDAGIQSDSFKDMEVQTGMQRFTKMLDKVRPTTGRDMLNFMKDGKTLVPVLFEEDTKTPCVMFSLDPNNQGMVLMSEKQKGMDRGWVTQSLEPEEAYKYLDNVSNESAVLNSEQALKYQQSIQHGAGPVRDSRKHSLVPNTEREQDIISRSQILPIFDPVQALQSQSSRNGLELFEKEQGHPFESFTLPTYTQDLVQNKEIDVSNTDFTDNLINTASQILTKFNDQKQKAQERVKRDQTANFDQKSRPQIEER